MKPVVRIARRIWWWIQGRLRSTCRVCGRHSAVVSYESHDACAWCEHPEAYGL